MLFNSYSYEILYEQFHWIYLQGDIKLLLVIVNNRLKFGSQSDNQRLSMCRGLYWNLFYITILVDYVPVVSSLYHFTSYTYSRYE